MLSFCYSSIVLSTLSCTSMEHEANTFVVASLTSLDFLNDVGICGGIPRIHQILLLCDRQELANPQRIRRHKLVWQKSISETFMETLLSYRSNRWKTYSCDTYVSGWNIIIICSIACGNQKPIPPPRLRRTSFVHPPAGTLRGVIITECKIHSTSLNKLIDKLK